MYTAMSGMLAVENPKACGPLHRPTSLGGHTSVFANNYSHLINDIRGQMGQPAQASIGTQSKDSKTVPSVPTGSTPYLH
jgi:hypothetical protein